MKYHNKGGSYRLDQPSPHRYTKWITERASKFNVLKSVNPLKCSTPNRAVEGLVKKVVDSLERKKDSSKAINFFEALEEIRFRYELSDNAPEIKHGDVKRFSNKFNLTDIIKDINNEIKVQCDELVKGSNNCYKHMNTEIKESTKEIFYDQIGQHIRLTYSYKDGSERSLFNDFDSPKEKKFQDFVKEVSASEGSADVPPEESGDEPDSEESVPAEERPARPHLERDERKVSEDGDGNLTVVGGGRRRRRRTASKRRSGKRRVTRKRSSKRRGGKKSVSKAGKRKTMKRKQ
jgi:hypothetical protein